MRGLAANLAGKAWRQVGQVFLPWPTHLLKHPRQKLCWQGACMCTCNVSPFRLHAPRQRPIFSARPASHPPLAACTSCMP